MPATVKQEEKKVEVFFHILAMFGGLSMFLYGMRLMGDGLKRSSGTAMKAAMAKVTNKPAIGFIFGMLVTCMIQSSTATIVLTVGMVGAGLLNFRQSIGIVLGANVGTAITAQIIRLMDLNTGSNSILSLFKADNLAPMALIIGIVLIMFVKRRNSDTTGTIFVGFGILFMGLIYMGDAVGEMGEGLTGMLTAFQGNYFLGFLAGVAVTAVIQSSSAVVGIIQTLASSVGVQFCGVFAVIIGVNIGDCLTTFIVSRIGAKPEQIRTALIHVIYNAFAAMLIIVVLAAGRLFGLIPDSLWNMTLNSGGVANVHGLFRLIPAVVLLPVSGVFANIAEKMVPDKPLNEEDAMIVENIRQLDEHLLMQPGLALSASGKVVDHMCEVAKHNYEAIVDQIYNYEDKRRERIGQREEMLDQMADASNNYLLKISPYITLESDSKNQSLQIKALTTFERIGDLAENCADDIESIRARGVDFSETALAELRILLNAVGDIMDLTFKAYTEKSSSLAKKVEPLEQVVDEIVAELRTRHIHRMTHNACNVYCNIPFENLISNMERISDKCSDMALGLIAYKQSDLIGHEHEYMVRLHESKDISYAKGIRDNHERYYTPLLKLENIVKQNDK